MSNRYGEAALMAAQQGPAPATNPEARWESAMERLYPTSPIARRKGAPRAAFLGLCEEGLVKGIPPGHYTKARENKMSAVRAVALLAEAAEPLSRSALWKAAAKDAGQKENGQIDVVLALWNNGLIVPRA